MNDNKSKGIGCGALFVILLTVAFIVLKLCNVIDWRWIMVVSPMWMYALLYVLTPFVLSAVEVAYDSIHVLHIKRKRNRRKQIKK